MSSDDRETSAPPVVTVAPVAADVFAVVPATPPPLVEPEMLVEGLRYLQQRVPEFTQLSVQEKRSHARAANLDPEFIEHGLHAACVWPKTQLVLKRSGEELRQEQEEIRHWDQVVRELRALTDGIEAANLKRKHRLGTAILQLYHILGSFFRYRTRPEDAYLRPYYDNMKHAYLRTQRFRKAKKEEPAAE
jgi:hypothetical protein